MANAARRQVCTPCYRAPEVVINRGRYDAAMDMWSVGCIFGELLHRMERSGSSFTPKLTIEPVFKLSPNTPRTPSMTTTFRDDEGLAKRVRLLHAPVEASPQAQHAGCVAWYRQQPYHRPGFSTPVLCMCTRASCAAWSQMLSARAGAASNL
jgi:serine/threonine protein kinase